MIIKLFLIKTIDRLGRYNSKLRGLYYRTFIKECGAKFNVRGKLYLHNPQNVYIGKNVTIGPYCRIETVESTDSDRKPKLEIGDCCKFEHLVHIYCGNKLSIGNDCMFASGCLVTDNNHGINANVGKYHSQKIMSKETIIDNNVWLGEHVSVLAGTIIGKNSIIGANSVVTNNIPENCIAVGIPAKVIKEFDFNKMKWMEYNG